MIFEVEDFPRGFFGETTWPSVEEIAMKQSRDLAKRAADRPSRAKPRGRVRKYAGVPVSVRRALREHVKQLRRKVKQ